MGRPEQMTRGVQSLLDSDVPDGVARVVVIAPADEASAAAARRLKKITPHAVRIAKRHGLSTAVQGWNAAKAAVTADWYVLGADDIVWAADWLTEAMAAVDPATEVVGLTDGGHTNIAHYAPHYMASHEFLASLYGGLMAPDCYGSWWFDREICHTARERGSYRPAYGAVLDHRHYVWGAAAMDATYAAGKAYHAADYNTYLQRGGVRWGV